jgi:hypothetical protein
MKKMLRILSILVISVILLAGLLMVILGGDKIDRCLDGGCSWDYQNKKCDCEKSHPGPTPAAGER